MQAIDTRRTIDDLRVLHVDLEPHLRDVYVEGRTDAVLIRWFLDRAGLDVGRVYAVDDRLVVDRERLDALDLTPGARNRVIALAAAAQDWDIRRAAITCVIDADRDYVVGGPTYDNLLRTDGGSLDLYLFQPRPFEHFLRLVLGLSEAAVPLMIQLIPTLQSLFVIRTALHLHHVKLVPNFVSCCDLVRGSVDEGELVRRSLAQAGRMGELDETMTQIESTRKLLPPDPMKSIRGHDVPYLLVRRLNLTNEWARPEVIEQAWRGCLELDDLRPWPLFQSLVVRLSYRD